jgi:hypothetical protein
VAQTSVLASFAHGSPARFIGYHGRIALFQPLWLATGPKLAYPVVIAIFADKLARGERSRFLAMAVRSDFVYVGDAV